MPLCKRINMFVHIGEILCRPIAWILLPDFLSCLSFATYAFRYFLFRSWTPKIPSVDPRLGTTDLARKFHCSTWHLPRILFIR